MHLHLMGSAELPVAAEGHHSAAWLVSLEAIHQSASQLGARRVRPWVALGSGKTIKGDWMTIK